MLINTTQKKTINARSDKTILESALAAGMVFDYSCKNGQCGVCKATLLEGEVTELQPQRAVSDVERENKQILLCCCSPKSDILIDAEDLIALTGIDVLTMPARINKITIKTNTILEVELRLPPSAQFKFLEGQYINVIGPSSVRRSYSIANSGGKLIKLFIRKVDNGWLSNYWFNNAKVSDLIRIEGPKGTFFFRDMTKSAVFLATGTGIAPIKAILDRLNEQGFEHNVSLYWGNRNLDDFFWNPNYPSLNFKYIPVLSQRDKRWNGQLGYVQDLAIDNNRMLDNVDVYACGTISMIEAAKAVFLKNGLGGNRFYSDAFVSS